MELTAKMFHELSTKELYEILKSRAEIFMMEQNIHCLDMDDIDYDSLHCFVLENQRVIAYLRAFYLNQDKNIVKIGRVLTLKHGMGIGNALMLQSLQAVKQKLKCEKILIDAQKHAVGFYEKYGFVTTSDDFLEEGIVHVTMELVL
ncbi:MAG: GNAT family N-acetyltransferase [Clostridia bacterium]|nr:GNAT family N-acetyltransferase [Clostridia bacterium]